VINLPYEVLVPVSRKLAKLHPRWVLETDKGPAQLLPTRHQRLVKEAKKEGLQCKVNTGSKFCNGDLADTAPYDVYRWVDGPTWRAEAQSVFDKYTVQNAAYEVQSGGKHVINVCFVGDSHSRMMIDYQFLMPKFIQFTYVFSIFPVVFNTSLLETHRCSVAVISHGLWTLTRSPYVHMKACFQREQEGLVSRLLQWRKPGGPRLYFRSENHNGLLADTVQCGGVDLRSPPGFDMVNRVKEEVCRNHQLEFINMDHIIYPMWDGAFDFNHPSGNVFVAEIDLILHRVFTDVLRHKEPLVAFSSAALAKEDVVSNRVITKEHQAAEVEKLSRLITAGDLGDCAARPRP
jgi:hypothetical protein